MHPIVKPLVPGAFCASGRALLLSHFFCLCVALVLALCTSTAARAQFDTLIENGPSSNRVDIFFLGDGYTNADLAAGTFSAHAQNYIDYVFTNSILTDPYYRYRKFFNAYTIDVPSNESGADIPQRGIKKDTAFDATYQFDGKTDRLLYIKDTRLASSTLRTRLAGSGKTADIKMVTVNTSVYGGGGGSWAVYAGGNNFAREVALHEVGHSFNRLADEYGGGDNYTGSEPARINVTRSPTGSKWSRWHGYSDPTGSIVGAYEGARYFDQGLYRPTATSKMRSLNKPFNAIGREKIILDIYKHVDPLDSFTSNSSILINPLALEATTVDDDVIDMQWTIDGVSLPAYDGLTSLDISELELGLGDHEILLRAFDPTGFDPVNGWVRFNTRQLEQFVSWDLTISVPEPSSVLLVVLGLFFCLSGRPTFQPKALPKATR